MNSNHIILMNEIYKAQVVKHENITYKFLKSNSTSVWRNIMKDVIDIVSKNDESLLSQLKEMLKKNM